MYTVATVGCPALAAIAWDVLVAIFNSARTVIPALAVFAKPPHARPRFLLNVWHHLGCISIE